METDGTVPQSSLDHSFQPDEGPPANEQDIGRIDLSKFLVRVLAASLRWYVGDGAFQDLEQGLLDAFARHIPRYGWVVILARNLIDLIDVDNALLRPLDVPGCVLQQLQNDIFDIFADVAGLGQRGGIDDGERHIEQFGQGLREKRLACAGRPDQHDIALGQFHIGLDLPEQDPLVVIIYGDGQLLFGLGLPDNVLVEEFLDFLGASQLGLLVDRFLDPFFLEDSVADRNALVANVGARQLSRGGDQFCDGVLGFMTERAATQLLRCKTFHKVLPVSAVLGYDLVDDAVFLGLLGSHPVIALDVALDFFQCLLRMFDKNVIEMGSDSEDFFRMNFDVGRLSGKPADGGLVNQHTGVRQRKTLAGASGGQNDGGNACGLPDADGRHGGPNELHGVVNRHSGAYAASRRVNVEGDVFLRVLSFEKQQLCGDQIGDGVVDRRAEKYNIFPQQAGKYVVSALAAVRLLDHHRN